MKITINPAIRHVQPFIERLPEVFPVSGEVLHEGRNQIRAFDIGGESLVVKRYKRPHLFNRVMYSFFRKNKARRAYEHALRLRGMGFDTPEPVAWSEYRKDGLIADTYFVSRRSELTPLPQTMRRFPAPDTLPVLEAFARFTVRLHEQGICHEDFNQTNILWEYDGAAGNYRFQLIDINRMRFHARPLRPDECMINLRRLSCPAVPVHIGSLCRHTRVGHQRHAAAGDFLPPALRPPAAVQKAVPGTEIGRRRQKTGLRIWIPQIFYYICRC